MAHLDLLKQHQLPMPRGAIALPPITDFAQISSTWLMYKWIEPMYVAQAAVAPQQHYLQGASVLESIASPIYGDLSGLPPILLVTGGVEALRDDSVGYVRKAIAHEVQARVHIWQGMPHVHMLMDFLPETALAEREIFAWVQNLATCSVRTRDEELWRNTVTLFNCTPFIGTVKRTTNGEHVYDPARAGVFGVEGCPLQTSPTYRP